MRQLFILGTSDAVSAVPVLEDTVVIKGILSSQFKFRRIEQIEVRLGTGESEPHHTNLAIFQHDGDCILSLPVRTCNAVFWNRYRQPPLIMGRALLVWCSPAVDSIELVIKSNMEQDLYEKSRIFYESYRWSLVSQASEPLALNYDDADWRPDSRPSEDVA